MNRPNIVDPMATENPVSKLIVKENKIETKWNHHAKCKRN